MKENRYIDENKDKVIENYRPAVSKTTKVAHDKHPYVIQEDDQSFLIVKEFSEDAKAGIVENFNRFDKSNLVKDASGKEIVYAEEVFDTEDELYANELHDTLIKKEKHRTYVEIGKSIDDALTLYGYRGEIGYPLLCSMRFSRFIHVQNHEGVKDELKALCHSMGVVFNHIPYNDKAENIASISEIFNIFSYAKDNSNKPVFIFVSDLPSKELMVFLRPIYGHIDNPNGDNYITSSGRIMYIPHNVWFIYTIQEGTMYSNISRRILRYSSDLEYELSKVSVEGVKQTPNFMSVEEINTSFREASEEFLISDESWRQIDAFVELIHPISGYALQNKIARSLEDYMVALKVSGLNDEQVLDLTLSRNFIKEAIICAEPQKYQTELLLDEALNSAFGDDKLPLTREKALWYVNQFDKGGNLKRGNTK